MELTKFREIEENRKIRVENLEPASQEKDSNRNMEK